MSDFCKSRRLMVDGQLKPVDVNNSVILDAFLKVPRENFVPNMLKSLAYSDGHLLLPNGRFLLKAATLAKLFQALNIKRTDRVLDVGCASGYSTMLLSYLAHRVIGIEESKELFLDAQNNFPDDEGWNVKIHHVKSFADGWKNDSPYNVIVIQGAVHRLHNMWLDQLADGGRLGVILKEETTVAYLFTRTKTCISRHKLFEAGSPMLEESGKQLFFSDYGIHYGNEVR